VQYGDTLGIIAASLRVSVYDILAVNPQIWNPSLIYAGQVINLPYSTGVPPVPSTPVPTPAYPSQYSPLKITYKGGLIVRNGAGKNYKMINSALHKTVWHYRTNSVMLDSKGYVWVEVNIVPPHNGYSSGWILVKDGLGNYFTDPHIDP
jgi:hypothetical protein